MKERRALRYPWTEQSFEMLLLLKKLGHNYEYIAQELERVFGYPCSKKIAQNRHNNRNSGFKAHLQRKPDKYRIYARKDPVQEANILHLLDLKRAGHSPRHTELKITNEGRPLRFEPVNYSYLTSPSYLCAQTGGW